MFKDSEQIEILKELGYTIKKHVVGERLRECGFCATTHDRIIYDVYYNEIYMGTLDKVFKAELKKRLFNL